MILKSLGRLDEAQEHMLEVLATYYILLTTYYLLQTTYYLLLTTY